MFRKVFIAFGALTALTAVPAVATERALSVMQEEVEAAKPATQGVGIDARLTAPDGAYRVGDTVGLTVRLSRDAYLTVVNISHDGATTVLFPNRFQPDQYIKGGVEMKMPGEGAKIVVTGNPGLELIKIVASEKPLDVTALGEFSTVGPFSAAGAGFAPRLARALSVEEVEEEQPAADPALTPEEEFGAWGEATLTLETLPADADADAPIGEVVAPVADASASLSISVASTTITVNDPIEITVSSATDCNLTMLAFGPTGNTTVLFPARAGDETLLKAGESRKIGGFKTTAPTGVETVKAICASPMRVAANTAADEGASDEGVTVTQRDIVLAEPAPMPQAEVAEAEIFITVTKQ